MTLSKCGAQALLAAGCLMTVGWQALAQELSQPVARSQEERQSDDGKMVEYAKDRKMCVYDSRFFDIGATVAMEGRLFTCSYRRTATPTEEAGNYWEPIPN